MKETIEEIRVDWDMESYPFPVMFVETVNEGGNAWLIRTSTTSREYKFDNSKNLLYNINNERKE